MKKLIACLLAAAMMLSMLAACSSGSSESTSEESAEVSATTETESEAAESESEEATSTTLRIGYDTEPTSLNPKLSTSGGGSVIMNAIYGLLWRITSEGVIMDLAESYEYNDDGTEMTIYLRESYFDNGDPVTAEDVLFTFEYYQEGAHSFHVMSIDFENSYAIDDTTVFIKLTAASSTFIENLALCHILSKTTYEELGDDGIGLEPMCSGAYTVTYWSTGEAIVLEKNEGYWNADNLVYDTVVVSCVGEETTRMLEFEAGSYDIMLIQQQSNVAKVASGEVEGAHMQYADQQCISYFAVNMLDFDTFSDINVRMAIAHAVDWEAIIETICGDGYVVATSPLLPSANYAYKYEGVYEYDPEYAAECLAAAGYAEGEFTFTARLADENFNAKIAEAMQAYLSEIGINMVISMGDSATVKEENRSNTIEMVYSQNMGADSPAGVVNSRMSNATPNATKMGLSSIQELLDDVCSTSYSKDEEIAIFQEIQDLMWENYICFPLYESQAMFAALDTMGDFSNIVDASSGYLHVSLLSTDMGY